MRVTPSTPSPRGSLSTTSHFSSQAQTPIQGMGEQRPEGSRWVDKDPGCGPPTLGQAPGEDGEQLRQPAVYTTRSPEDFSGPAFAHSLSERSLTYAQCLTPG